MTTMPEPNSITLNNGKALLGLKNIQFSYQWHFFSGDTTFDVFTKPPTPDLLKAKVLITEATYIDPDIDRNGSSTIAKARERGHAHLLEFVDNAQLFENTQHLILTHMSDKYSPNYIRDRVAKVLPDSLKSKVYLGTQLKERTTVAAGTS